MKRFCLAAAALLLVVGLSAPSFAQSYTCANQLGTWTEANETWTMSYVISPGSSGLVVTGTYSSPTGATGTISGSIANGGTSGGARQLNWQLDLSYTDAAHSGWKKSLTGQEIMKSTLEHNVAGSFTVTRNGTAMVLNNRGGDTFANAQGTFTLSGKCTNVLIRQ